MTCRVWPSGCVCQLVRAPGSKVTQTARTRAGSGASLIGTCQTRPVNQSGLALRIGVSEALRMSMSHSLDCVSAASPDDARPAEPRWGYGQGGRIASRDYFVSSVQMAV